tara:strand:- start:1237 stop:1386 length:150 start_codon:yes stop_codon:yes gene_type:complete
MFQNVGCKESAENPTLFGVIAMPWFTKYASALENNDPLKAAWEKWMELG